MNVIATTLTATALFLSPAGGPTPAAIDAPSTPVVPSATAPATNNDVVGEWMSVDDDGKTVKSKVRIYEKNGKIFGKIVHLTDPKKRTKLCDQCPGSRKNQPILGLEIIRDMSRDGDRWEGGRILDPESGKEYRCYLELQANGTKLKVRGYLGISLLGRTQIWRRAQG